MEETRNSVAESSQRRCPYCGEKIGPDHVFCPYCGESLTQRRDEPVAQQHYEPHTQRRDEPVADNHNQVVEPQNPADPVESEPTSQSESVNLGAIAIAIMIPTIYYGPYVSVGVFMFFMIIAFILSIITLITKRSDILATISLVLCVMYIIYCVTM
jgi:hypothetical protein